MGREWINDLMEIKRKIKNTLGAAMVESSLLKVAHGLINIIRGILCDSSTENPIKQKHLVVI